MPLRVGIGAVLLAVLIAAFSLQQLPDPLRADLTADAFDGPAAVRTLDELATRYPDRRAGSPGDQALTARVREELRRALPAASMAADRFRADTPDGERELENVSATLPGQPGPEIVVVAHRDALERGAKAELSGTAGLIGLARAAGNGRFRHTVRFVSTSGASGGGLAGATQLARTLGGRTAAVLVLGDLAGRPDQAPSVVPWSNGGPAAPVRLERTVVEALREEGLHARAETGLWTQVVRRGLPATVGEQGEINQAGVPAVLLSAGGATPPRADAQVDQARLTAYGRAALRTLYALDDRGGSIGAQQSGIVLVGQELPVWALRLLLLALLAPLLVGAAIVGLTLGRDGHPLAAGAAWTAGCAVGPLVAGLLAIGLGRIGLVWPSVPAPYAGAAVRTGPGAGFVVALLAAILVATVVVARPTLTRDATGLGRPTRVTVAAGVFATLMLVVLALVVVDPIAALLVLPALLAWPAAIAPLPIEPIHRLLLVFGGLVLPLAAGLTVTASLDVPWTQVPWWLVLMIAGGQITPVGLLLMSLLVGALIATVATFGPRPRRNRRPADRERRPPPDRGARRRASREAREDMADAYAEGTT
ncbi:M28 family peptidase [Patulibacter defluvii]|uniref:M28 family peptidase n=1 Tax=Patulibacter defluvii TaxID=3095358 RepID=UPI002A76228A|nr:M28 family peptidase [Patulibacter sp. DM4]